MSDIEQLCDTKNIKMVRGDTLSAPVIFSFDITGYTIVAETDSEVFTVTADDIDPTHTVHIGITPEQSEKFENQCTWYLRYIDTDGYVRTANKAKIILI